MEIINPNLIHFLSFQIKIVVYNLCILVSSAHETTRNDMTYTVLKMMFKNPNK